MCWAGIGQSTIDCMIASFYILIEAEFLMLRHHLKNITDLEFEENEAKIIEYQKVKLKYLDDDEVISNKLQEKFIYNVQKYKSIIWYVTIYTIFIFLHINNIISILSPFYNISPIHLLRC